jgi:hypothetical protein
MAIIEPPKAEQESYFRYLDELRESGITNMFGAAPYLAYAFDLDRQEARKVLAEWMRTFGARHPKKDRIA